MNVQRRFSLKVHGPMFLAATPILWIAWFYLFVGRQRLLLGYWPKPYQPDPKLAGYVVHHLSIYFGFSAIPLALVGAGVWVAARHRDHHDVHWKSFVVFLSVSLFLLIMTIVIDPGNYFEWFMD